MTNLDAGHIPSVLLVLGNVFLCILIWIHYLSHAVRQLLMATWDAMMSDALKKGTTPPYDSRAVWVSDKLDGCFLGYIFTYTLVTGPILIWVISCLT